MDSYTNLQDMSALFAPIESINTQGLIISKGGSSMNSWSKDN